MVLVVPPGHRHTAVPSGHGYSAVPSGHGYAAGPNFAEPSIPVQALDGETFVGFTSELTIRKQIDRWFKQARISVDFVHVFDNVENIKRAVEIGSGVALLPAPTVRREVEAGPVARGPHRGCAVASPAGHRPPAKSDVDQPGTEARRASARPPGGDRHVAEVRKSECPTPSAQHIQPTELHTQQDRCRSQALRPASKYGLYDPAFEHDSCGVGFVANIKGVRVAPDHRRRGPHPAAPGASRRDRLRAEYGRRCRHAHRLAARIPAERGRGRPRSRSCPNPAFTASATSSCRRTNAQRAECKENGQANRSPSRANACWAGDRCRRGRSGADIGPSARAAEPAMRTAFHRRGRRSRSRIVRPPALRDPQAGQPHSADERSASRR